jgi:hypothetical protein
LIALRRAVSTMGAKTDLDIFQNLAYMMGVQVNPPTPSEVYARLAERGFTLPVRAAHPHLIRPANDTMFTSGTLGRYCNTLNSLSEAPGELYRWTS